jgi:fumarate reductase subunit C
MPASWWGSKRILTYLLFDATGIIYFLVAFQAIRLIAALGDGPIAWTDAMDALRSPLNVGFNALSLVSVVFVAVRFFRLFPKAQPPMIGSIKPPPAAVIHATLYVVWLGITALMTAILAGVLF